MATLFEVVLPFGTPGAMEIGEEALDLIDDLEAQLTVYRDTSEVSRLNRMASLAPIPVDGQLFDLLQLASRLTEETDGAFDIATGALIKAWGFFRGPRRIPSPGELEEVLRRVGSRHVSLDQERQTVRYLQRGLEVNLGAIGKGYALDRAIRLLEEEWKIPAVLLHGGYSSLYAKGNPPGDPRGWKVGITHPTNPQRRLGFVFLRDRALGTSAATFQYLEHEGRKLGHILDPRTGWSASGMASVSVLAPTGALADALSTAFFIGGTEMARLYCEKHPEIGAILLPEGESVEPLILGVAPHEIALVG